MRQATIVASSAKYYLLAGATLRVDGFVSWPTRPERTRRDLTRLVVARRSVPGKAGQGTVSIGGRHQTAADIFFFMFRVAHLYVDLDLSAGGSLHLVHIPSPH